MDICVYDRAIDPEKIMFLVSDTGHSEHAKDNPSGLWNDSSDDEDGA